MSGMSYGGWGVAECEWVIFQELKREKNKNAAEDCGEEKNRGNELVLKRRVSNSGI